MSEVSPANLGSDLIVLQVCKSCRALWQRSALLGVSTACNNTENSSCVISLISCHWPGLSGLFWNTKLWQAVMTREVMTICIWSCILVWNIFSVLTSEIFPTLSPQYLPGYDCVWDNNTWPELHGNSTGFSQAGWNFVIALTVHGFVFLKPNMQILLCDSLPPVISALIFYL